MTQAQMGNLETPAKIHFYWVQRQRGRNPDKKVTSKTPTTRTMTAYKNPRKYRILLEDTAHKPNNGSNMASHEEQQTTHIESIVRKTQKGIQQEVESVEEAVQAVHEVINVTALVDEGNVLISPTDLIR